MSAHDSSFASAAPTRDFTQFTGPKGIPVLGNMLQLDSLRFHRQLEDWAEQYGNIYRLRLASREALVVSDPAMIATMLHDRPDAFRRSSRTAAVLEELGTRGLFTAEGEEWRKQRKLVMRALTPEVIRNFFPTMVLLTERLRRRWEENIRRGEPVDILRDLKAYALDVTVWLAMGHDINTLEHPENPLQRDIEFMFNRVARRVTTPLPYWRYFKLDVDRQADAAAQRISASVTGFIEQARRELHDSPALRDKPRNMLQALLLARDEPNSGFDDSHVIGNAGTMVFAGEDTTSNTIGWLVYFLARHPEAAERLRQETDSVLTGPVNDDFASLEKFSWLDAAVNEAMRLKPVAPFMAAEANHDTVVGGVTIPKGIISFLLLRRSSFIANQWEAASSFLPERWLADGRGNPMSPASDVARKISPFGGGPRFCPGRYLAFAEIRMVSSMLARNFNLHYDQAAKPVDEIFTFTMTPDSMPVRLTLR
ncbi:cytochrome P450 [Noviherbaspirillum galbum]|uniref:Cytochrome P450 n=1 Tax=Noviherbaspirillum galbum TaxID=2709383 RepID=A0A6B3SN15_9BURK|nr:cytochrome P450 [Noviherbaspirillum galbum]NEX62204.1 cytochrome P450 [Noviherbaspirillum galbum]